MNRRDVKRQAILDTAYRLFRQQGFAETSVSQITAQVGGSKATIYSHFSSKEELFVECMAAAAEEVLTSIATQADAQLEASDVDPRHVLQAFGTRFLSFACSPEFVAVRRLMIAEASRASIGKLFLDKLAAMRTHVEALLAHLMAAGLMREANLHVAADHYRGLLESEVIEPLLLSARDNAPEEAELNMVAARATEAFLRAYAPPAQTLQPCENDTQSVRVNTTSVLRD